MQIELRDITTIRPYDNNPRNNDAAVDAVAASIRQFGFRQPIVVDEAGVIICGHTRYKASLKLGLKQVPDRPGIGMGVQDAAAPTCTAGAVAGVALAFQSRIGRSGRGQPSQIVPTLAGTGAGATSDSRPCVATRYTAATGQTWWVDLAANCQRIMLYPAWPGDRTGQRYGFALWETAAYSNERYDLYPTQNQYHPLGGAAPSTAGWAPLDCPIELPCWTADWTAYFSNALFPSLPPGGIPPEPARNTGTDWSCGLRDFKAYVKLPFQYVNSKGRPEGAPFDP